MVEPGAGAHANAPDAAYTEMGATLGDPWAAEVVVKVAPPSDAEVGKLARRGRRWSPSSTRWAIRTGCRRSRRPA